MGPLPDVHQPNLLRVSRLSIRARGMRILISVLLLLIFIPEWMGEKKLDLFGPDPVMTASHVALDSTDAAHRRVGRLTWLGGVRLTSPDPAFGGFSSLHVVRDRFTLLSDGGNIVQ